MYKYFDKNLITVTPFNIHKNWEFGKLDINPFSSSQQLYNFLSSIYNIQQSQIVRTPLFPFVNVKAGVLYTGSVSYVDTSDVYNMDDYLLSYNYQFAESKTFWPTYESASGRINPDGTYMKIVYYSVLHDFYSQYAPYRNQLNTRANVSSSLIYDKVFVIEFPKRYVAYGIEPGTFTYHDTSNLNDLPYSGSNTSTEGVYLYDDTSGSLYDSYYSASGKIGDILYKEGFVIITEPIYVTYFKKYLIDTGSAILI